MVSLICRAGLLGVVLLIGAAAEADEAQQQRKLDPDKLFQKLDANGDNKISKDEFAKLVAQFQEKLGDKGKELAARMFERLDSNKDGFLSKEELAKAREQLGNNEELKKKLQDLKQKLGNVNPDELKKKLEELKKRKPTKP